MLIWGSRGREIEQERGTFHCPRCDSPQWFKKVRVATYFTLYFIPVFETQHHGDYIECFGCNGQFKPEVLEYKPPSQAEQALQSIRADQESGTPLQMARTKLVNAGIAADVAEQLVTVAAGNVLWLCSVCNLSFLAGIARCSSCGGAIGRQAPQKVVNGDYDLPTLHDPSEKGDRGMSEEIGG